MRLTGPQLKQLQQALLRAFPTFGSLGEMVRFGLDENLNAISGEGKLREVVFNLVTWAETEGRLRELINKAREANPGNPDWKHFEETIGQAERSTRPIEAVNGRATIDREFLFCNRERVWDALQVGLIAWNRKSPAFFLLPAKSVDYVHLFFGRLEIQGVPDLGPQEVIKPRVFDKALVFSRRVQIPHLLDGVQQIIQNDIRKAMHADPNPKWHIIKTTIKVADWPDPFLPTAALKIFIGACQAHATEHPTRNVLVFFVTDPSVMEPPDPKPGHPRKQAKPYIVRHIEKAVKSVNHTIYTLNGMTPVSLHEFQKWITSGYTPFIGQPVQASGLIEAIYLTEEYLSMGVLLNRFLTELNAWRERSSF